MTGTNQSGIHDSLVIVLFQIRNRSTRSPPLLTLRSGSNGSSTLQRTQAGGGSLGEKPWRLTVDGGFFFFFGWRFELSCCQQKNSPGNFEAKIQVGCLFFAPCRVIQVRFFLWFQRFSCFFGGGWSRNFDEKSDVSRGFWDASGGKILIPRFWWNDQAKEETTYCHCPE